jgi:hypothetical protein
MKKQIQKLQVIREFKGAVVPMLSQRPKKENKNQLSKIAQLHCHETSGNYIGMRLVVFISALI